MQVGDWRTRNRVGVEDFKEGERRWRVCRRRESGASLRAAVVIECEEEERVGLLVDKGGDGV